MIGRSICTSAGELAHFAGELADRFGDHLDVEVEADRGDVTRLLGAEQVARAADLEVAHRDLEAGTEVGELADRLQALVRLLGERTIARIQEVRVRALPAPADPAAQLVELREAEHVGPVDDERVHRRHVEAALDDRRAHEHVVLPLPELGDDPLEPAFVHLAVRDRDARVGHELAHVGGDVLRCRCTRLCTKSTWPSRSSSRRIASDTARASYSPT